MLMLSGLRGDPYSDCLASYCDAISDPDGYASCSRACQLATFGGPSGTPPDPAFLACADKCTGDDACISRCAGVYASTSTVTSLPRGVAPNLTTNVPGTIQPGAGYQPAPATNWYKIAGLAIIGASVLAATIFYVRATHAA